MGYASAQQHGHSHGEAFMLMTYACEACGHRETIWNSRDGVTPFGCGCPSCGKTLNHVEWQSDVYAPNHKLRPRQRFWRDGTPDEAEAIMRRRIDQMRGQYPLSPSREAALIASVRNGTEGEFQNGWPTLDEHQ
jgi:ribosomal protein S27E